MLYIDVQVITRGTNNTVVLTLTERTSVSGAYYLVRAQNRATNQVKRFLLASNLSVYPERYDQFTITETSGTEILSSGTVTLLPGDWHYQIYEQTSSSNLDETQSDTTEPIEYGIFRVPGTSDTYIQPPENDIYVS